MTLFFLLLIIVINTKHKLQETIKSNDRHTHRFLNSVHVPQARGASPLCLAALFKPTCHEKTLFGNLAHLLPSTACPSTPITMRRSKSEPSKYARNYRRISQRRMTQYDNLDEDHEIERLRSILKTSEKHLQQVEGPPNSTGLSSSGKKRRRKENGYGIEPLNRNEHEDEDSHSERKGDRTGLSFMSDELLAEGAAMGLASRCDSENPLIVLPSHSKKKQRKDKTAVVPLSPEEIREAKALQKNTARKLQQLETRAAQKKKRADLYKRLEESNQISQAMALQPLLASSGKLSRKDSDTKKQALKKILNKERAGLALTEGERDLLYPERTVRESSPMSATQISDRIGRSGMAASKERKHIGDGNLDEIPNHPRQGSEDDNASVKVDTESVTEMENETNDATVAVAPTAGSTNSKTAASGFDFATQMMASLSRLTDESKPTKAEVVSNTISDLAVSVEPDKRYVPTNPTVLKTAATMGLQPSLSENSGHLKQLVMEINRPTDVEKTRMDLPVTAMEYEIMDAIRSNDVTIICSETGSGKSTQIPAYLYEAGMSHSPRSPETSFLIGITQPRRVAAVSTAKRVCYEMGQGDGQTIRGSNGNGNLVAYKTRYETAGTGKATRIQFMTDGILLSEIQSDLLLRRYSVIVLDESHERNLNTDVLIGLLSKTLPLRKKAAEEDPTMVPLKLILMSATLRVEDFTLNEMLFPTGPPAVVTVPGRTHPVTVHHSKTTELDDYGKFEIPLLFTGL
jgi:ATP-dependent RNA helicase DHX37/DHR1